MKRNVEYGAFALLVAISVGVLWVVIAPTTFPGEPILGVLSVLPSVVGDLDIYSIILTVVVILLTADQVIARGSVGIGTDRSLITPNDPETALTGSTFSAGTPIDETIQEAKQHFHTTDEPLRRVAMYGYRGTIHRSVPGVFTELELRSVPGVVTELFQEMASTLTGALEANPDGPTDPATAVANGTWTDDRIAAAFLATADDPAATFTFTERLFAWFSPEKTFTSRLERTINEIEAQAKHDDGFQPSGEASDTAADGRADEEAGGDAESEPQTIRTTISRGETSEPTREYTARLRGLVVAFGILVSGGILTLNPAIVAAAAIIPVVMLIALWQEPDAPGDNLTITYDVTPAFPRPAEAVTITATIEHTGDSTFTDLRLVDSVPPELEVVDGSPRAAGTLRPGESITIEYTVVAKRGSYAFGPLTARVRSLTGATYVQQTLSTSGDRELRCAVSLDELPLEDDATQFFGQLLSDEGGEGIEFYSTREYRRGDKPSRVNWREYAKRGELSTVTYREEKAADIALIVDARPWARVSAAAGMPSGATLSAYAAYQMTSAFSQANHRTRVAVPGLEPAANRGEAGGIPFRRLEPGSGSDQRRRMFDLLDEINSVVEAETTSENDVMPLRSIGELSLTVAGTLQEPFGIIPFKTTMGEVVNDLLSWTTQNSQFVIITPLLDGGIQALATHLRELEQAVIVVSPDVTVSYNTGGEDNGRTLGDSLASIQRQARIQTLREQGISVIDWNPTVPLAVACDRQTTPAGGQ